MKEGNYLFPLKLNIDDENRQVLSFSGLVNSNMKTDFLNHVSETTSFQFSDEQVFYYIYALLHSNSYRERYENLLQMDFPRIPITSSKILFITLSEYGQDLVAIHLFKSGKLGELITEFEEAGHRSIASGYPKYANGRVTINQRGAGFTGVPEEVWNFYIGGYQVCHKWLKDRKGRSLSDDDILHYQKIIVALQETIRIMQQIDEAIPSWPIE